MKDIQNIIDNFPNISKEDMYKRLEEYRKIIENEFENSSHSTTLPISLVQPCATMKPIDLSINKLNKD